MKTLIDMLTVVPRIQASNATQDTIFRVLYGYLEEVKSRGDNLNVDTFYDDFRRFYKKNWLNF